MLDPDTLLLEYALGEERSYVWAVTPTSITSYELPKRAEIEEAARQVYARWQKPSKRREPKRAGKEASASAAVATALLEAATRLSQMLLAPVATQLGQKRLLIVGDGALQYHPLRGAARSVDGQDGCVPTAHRQARDRKPAVGFDARSAAARGGPAHARAQGHRRAGRSGL